jgi:hypothetical protein
MLQKQRTTLEIDKKIYENFKSNCKNHNLPMNIVLEVLIEKFNDNQKRIAAQIKRYGKIEIAKQRVAKAQRGHDGKAF